MIDDGIKRRWYGGIGIPENQFRDAAKMMMHHEDAYNHSLEYYEKMLDIGLHELWPDKGPIVVTDCSVRLSK